MPPAPDLARCPRGLPGSRVCLSRGSLTNRATAAVSGRRYVAAPSRPPPALEARVSAASQRQLPRLVLLGARGPAAREASDKTQSGGLRLSPRYPARPRPMLVCARRPKTGLPVDR